jgi:hypothetical protein
MVICVQGVYSATSASSMRSDARQYAPRDASRPRAASEIGPGEVSRRGVKQKNV